MFTAIIIIVSIICLLGWIGHMIDKDNVIDN